MQIIERYILSIRVAKLEKKYSIWCWQSWGENEASCLLPMLGGGTVQKNQKTQKSLPQEHFGNSYPSLKNLPIP